MAWRRKARRRQDVLIGGPPSTTRWVTKAGLRVAFTEAMFMVLVLLGNDVDTLSTVADGEASVFPPIALVLITPKYLAVAGIILAVALLPPFLPWHNEATSHWE